MTKSPYQAPEGIGAAVTGSKTLVKVEFLVPKDVHNWLKLQCENNGNAPLSALLSHLVEQGIAAVQARQVKGFWARVAAFFSRR